MDCLWTLFLFPYTIQVQEGKTMEDVLTNFHRKLSALSSELRLLSEQLDELYFVVFDMKRKLIQNKEIEEETELWLTEILT